MPCDSFITGKVAKSVMKFASRSQFADDETGRMKPLPRPLDMSIDNGHLTRVRDDDCDDFHD